MTRQSKTPAGPSSSPAERKITVDAEHFGVRFMVPVAALSITLIWHFIGLNVLPDLLGGIDALCIVLPLDFVLLLASGAAVERTLKQRMPSRRYATLSPSGLVMTDARRDPPTAITIDWDNTVNVRAWRFTIRRRTRVPKGWYCMAIQLLQDETDIILYTFMPPQEAEHMPGYNNFVRLRARQETESNTDLNAVAEQRRLLKLEDARWKDGAEIQPDDFRAVAAVLEQVVPGWI